MTQSADPQDVYALAFEELFGPEDDDQFRDTVDALYPLIGAAKHDEVQAICWQAAVMFVINPENGKACYTRLDTREMEWGPWRPCSANLPIYHEDCGRVIQ